jgi:hypothetical protein
VEPYSCVQHLTEAPLFDLIDFRRRFPNDLGGDDPIRYDMQAPIFIMFLVFEGEQVLRCKGGRLVGSNLLALPRQECRCLFCKVLCRLLCALPRRAKYKNYAVSAACQPIDSA